MPGKKRGWSRKNRQNALAATPEITPTIAETISEEGVQGKQRRRRRVSNQSQYQLSLYQSNKG